MMRAALATAMAGLVFCNPAQAFSPRVGQPIDDFTLPRIDTGKAVSLSQFRGKKVLLIQFASW